MENGVSSMCYNMQKIACENEANQTYIYFMSLEQDELDGKYSLISCRNTCVLLCMMLSCLAQTLECCLHCMSLPVIGQGMPVCKWLAVNRWSWSLSATLPVCGKLFLQSVFIASLPKSAVYVDGY